MANTALFVFFYLFLYISLVGALNWGLVGALNFDLVEFLSNRRKSVQKGIYIFIGFSALVLFILSMIVMFSYPEGYLGGPEEEFLPHDPEEKNHDYTRH